MIFKDYNKTFKDDFNEYINKHKKVIKLSDNKIKEIL